jgi:hypothetical protein
MQINETGENMTDQNSTTVGQSSDPTDAPQPVISVGNAQTLVRDFIASIPDLSNVRTELSLVAALSVMYVDNPLGPVDRSQFLTDLGSLHHTDVETVSSAIEAIRNTENTALTAISDSVQQTTGKPLNMRTLDLDSIAGLKLKELDGLDQLAKDLEGAASAMINRLGVRDLYELKRSATVPVPAKVSTATALFNSLGSLGKRKKQTTMPEDVPVPVDWFTTPLLTDKNPEYAVVLERILNIIRLMDRYQSNKDMRQVVLDTLVNVPVERDPTKTITVDVIESSVQKAYELAAQQKVQTAQMRIRVQNDIAQFRKPISAVQNLRKMYGGVQKLLSK